MILLTLTNCPCQPGTVAKFKTDVLSFLAEGSQFGSDIGTHSNFVSNEELTSPNSTATIVHAVALSIIQCSRAAWNAHP
jgi:hypothetical protein